jgi:hypothetical protein
VYFYVDIIISDTHFSKVSPSTVSFIDLHIFSGTATQPSLALALDFFQRVRVLIVTPTERAQGSTPPHSNFYTSNQPFSL